MIPGVLLTPLRQMIDERGKVMHMLKSTDPHFIGFGEIYFSCINPGAIKAWNCHQESTSNLAVIHGEIKLVIYDNRSSQRQLQELLLGNSNYQLVTIPPGVWVGFTATSPEPAIVANCATFAHRPEESLRLPCGDSLIPYRWELNSK